MMSGREGNTSHIVITRPTSVSQVAGEVLRQVRQSRALSLRQVTIRSSGMFKPSSVASYERGERALSLDRLFALARVYGVAPEQIVAAIAYRVEEQARAEEGGESDRSVVFLETPPENERTRPRDEVHGAR